MLNNPTDYDGCFVRVTRTMGRGGRHWSVPARETQFPTPFIFRLTTTIQFTLLTVPLQHTSTRLRTERYRKTIRSNDGHVGVGGPRLVDVPCGNAAPHRHHTTHFPQRPAPLGRSCSKNNNTVRRWHSPHRCLQRLLQHRGTLLTGAETEEGQALDPASGNATIAMPTSQILKRPNQSQTLTL